MSIVHISICYWKIIPLKNKNYYYYNLLIPWHIVYNILYKLINIFQRFTVTILISAYIENVLIVRPFVVIYSGVAPVIPFMSTILKQRGYSLFVIGLILTILPIPGIFLRPTIGAVTDKFKCRKSAVFVVIIVWNLFVCVLWLIPGSAAGREMDGVSVIKSPQFWLFFCTVVMLKTANTTRNTLEDTICVDLLGKPM